MRSFLVGGAVRDEILGLPVKERDFVVLGATPEMLIAQGYRPVGKDFPVFLHPKTREEYALARTERKIARGYHGFEFYCSPDITLEEDLKRRDLTVNAIARSSDGHLIDPYGGLEDLRAKILRHVSPAFAEDPVRILRVARFAARFSPLGFVVADETMALMSSMVDEGEVDALVPERVFSEFQKALMEPAPEAFLAVLRGCGALRVLFPEIAALDGVPEDPQHHPEFDTGVHLQWVLKAACKLTCDPRIRFAAWVHDVGKAQIPKAEWLRHEGYEAKGVPPLRALCSRLRVPSTWYRLAEKVVMHHAEVHNTLQLDAVGLMELIEQLDGIRQPKGIDEVLIAAMADSRGRPGCEDRPYPQGDRLRRARDLILAVRIDSQAAESLKGPAFGEALRSARIRALQTLFESGKSEI